MSCILISKRDYARAAAAFVALYTAAGVFNYKGKGEDDVYGDFMKLYELNYKAFHKRYNEQPDKNLIDYKDEFKQYYWKIRDFIIKHNDDKRAIIESLSKFLASASYQISETAELEKASDEIIDPYNKSLLYAYIHYFKNECWAAFDIDLIKREV